MVMRRAREWTAEARAVEREKWRQAARSVHYLNRVREDGARSPQQERLDRSYPRRSRRLSTI